MADTESLGEAGVVWLEGLACSPEKERRVAIPTINAPDLQKEAAKRKA